MPSDFVKITAFYVPIGSPDYPKAWSPTDNFGFTRSGSTYVGPCYNTNLYSVMNVFKDPITFVKKFSITSDPVSNYISQLIFGKPSSSFVSSSLSVDNISNRYITVMMMLDYLFINQYKSTLVADFNSLVSVILGTRSTHYINSSLTVSTNTNDSSRLNYVSFIINFSDMGTTDTVVFKVYFNPDELLINESKDRKQVFLYEDTNNDEYIDIDEWKAKIVEKHIAIFGDARYSIYKCKTYDYYYTDVGGIIRGPIPRFFFVYSLIELIDIDAVNSIREYVLNLYGDDLTISRSHYPDLFTNMIVNIYPIETKQSELSPNFLSPVSYGVFKSILDANNVNIGDNNFSSSEVFFIGCESADIVYNIPLAAIAVNSDIGASTGPISIGFKNYSPIFRSIDYATETEIAVKFHKLVRLALSVIYGVLSPSSVEITNIISLGVNFSIATVNGSYEVTIVLNGSTYVVKKP